MIKTTPTGDFPAARDGRPVRLLFANRLYWPDSHLLRTLATRLASRGIDVEVLCEQPTYKAATIAKRMPSREIDHGVKIRRLGVLPGARSSKFLLLLDKGLFPARVVIKAIGRRFTGRCPDYIGVQTMPPVIIGLAGVLAAKVTGARLVYHFQDIYPELAAAHGMLREKSWLYRLSMALDRWNLRRCWRCIVLSTDMADTIAARGVERDKIRIINNFVSDDFDAPPETAPEEFARTPGIHRVIFAGNIGRFQHLDEVVEAAALLESRRPDIELVLMGDGKRAAALRERMETLSNARFFPHQTVEVANAVVADATIGLVPLAPRIHSYAFPSKTLTYMALGIPMVAVIEEDSDLARLIEQHQIGACAASHAPEAIADAIERAVDTRIESDAERERIQQLYQTTFSVETACEKWMEILVPFKNR